MEGSGEESSMLCLLRPTQTSHILTTFKNPMKPSSREDDSSVYNLEKTKPVKQHRCMDFDDCVRKAHSSQDVHAMQDFKHGQQETVSTSYLELHMQEQDKQLQNSGEVHERDNGSGKRRRLPEDGNSLEISVLCPESLDILDFPSTMDNQSSSKSTECGSSASGSENPENDELSRPSGITKRRRLKLKQELKTHNQQNFNMNLKTQYRDGMENGTGAYLGFEINEIPQSAFVGNGLEFSCSCLDPVHASQQDVRETALVDVNLTVKASYRAENVPFVCLTSKLNGKAILGYPLEIGELGDGSESLLPRKEGGACKLFDDDGSRLHKLVWKTSKRSPVCYITNSLSSSISKNEQPGRASKTVEDSISPATENGLKEQSLIKLLQNPKQLIERKAAPNRTCVPVELIFSKILAAVGQVQA
ncbi:hypothetical protein Salat_1830100 [Sesamum alatum]|uniref:Uncharacterized protein n=1 Tax=Sesamum alatum TaxID=300844 RepID=A0AAE1Y392_9LAMI|nr:hypothetical protein Salat_1830100 [Sesamum alatum]